MPTPFATEDLSRLFDGQTMTRGRSLQLQQAVEVSLDGDTITGAVNDRGVRRTATITPSQHGRRVAFELRCTCRAPACPHLAATALAALDRFPALRRAEQRSMFDTLASGAAAEPKRLVFDLSPGVPPHACFVTTSLIGTHSGKAEPTTPKKIIADPTHRDAARLLARALGGGELPRVGVSAAAVPSVLGLLLSCGLGRWAATGPKLVAGGERSFDASVAPKLPAGSAILLSPIGPWYVDAATGDVGRVRARPAPAAAPGGAVAGKPAPSKPVAVASKPAPKRPEPIEPPPRISDAAIVERPVVPVMRLRRLKCPDDYGRLQQVDALALDFDYGGVITDGDDERQFVRTSGTGGPSFVRRDPAAEAAAFEALKPDGFVQMRVAEGQSARGRRVLVFRGPDAGERWLRFMTERMPALTALGWRNQIEGDFGPRMAERVGGLDMRIADAEGAGAGRFSLDFGIEIDGKRWPLLPILSRLLDQGGMEAAHVVDGEIVTSLDDGRVVKLPAERIGRLLAIMGDLIGNATRLDGGALELPQEEAATVADLEDVLTARWQNAAQIEEYVARFRDSPEIVPAVLPAEFKASLRPYQQQGVDWLQHLRSHGLSGFLADDMGLGKTAQTIAHICVEHAEGRLDRPALIVVPTSLISNWTAELTKFAPHLRKLVLHGLDRHERRRLVDGVNVVITTYTVLARDITEMQEIPFHLVVLDEAQAIKSPDAKATKAVCQLDSRFRLCLSGTPIENNLGELWSQFAFLMPGVLGDRRDFNKRFRTPIEKKGDDLRRRQLVRRIRPFLLRRTKSEVAADLPPKHTILRRITLAPDQRELYETIRVTLHEKVREQMAELTPQQSRIVVLDALLKLRQACCDPRLVKLASARATGTSSKLDDLMEMLGEMLPEGRKVLLFSQFTSMLDLIKPRLDEAGIKYVELRGDTRDRAEPVRSFQAGEVPLFLISLKAGGRGLNLTAADTVIHYDPWWNPAVEDQASDRAHRIGQTKSVFVYKMIGADTVEERILELQERKADLANSAFSDSNELGPLDDDDIAYLFGDEEKRAAA